MAWAVQQHMSNRPKERRWRPQPARMGECISEWTAAMGEGAVAADRWRAFGYAVCRYAFCMGDGGGGGGGDGGMHNRMGGGGGGGGSDGGMHNRMGGGGGGPRALQKETGCGC